MTNVGTFRGLALVTRESNRLVLVAAIARDEELLKNIAEKALEIRWEEIVERCRVIEVEISERMN
jgi:hypothetical protein